MPYVNEHDRNQVAWVDTADTPGQLNYVITRCLIDYVNGRGLSYQTINDVLGALEGAKQEFYRRVAVPYEHEKILENGDVSVYPSTMTMPRSSK